MTTRFAVAALLLCAVALPVGAETPRCEGIAEVKARLDCRYQVRHSHRARLERALHEHGSSANVYLEEIGEAGSGAYPRLIIWAPLTDSTVRKLTTDAKILDEARAAGFKMVLFSDKATEVQWFFDLTRRRNEPIRVEGQWQAPKSSPL